jgi:hypothetical protein
MTPQQRHWSIFKNSYVMRKARGNLIPVAWLAALAIDAGCEWITRDEDFAIRRAAMPAFLRAVIFTAASSATQTNNRSGYSG